MKTTSKMSVLFGGAETINAQTLGETLPHIVTILTECGATSVKVERVSGVAWRGTSPAVEMILVLEHERGDDPIKRCVGVLNLQKFLADKDPADLTWSCLGRAGTGLPSTGDLAKARITDVLADFDPEGLVKGGAPRDEYSGEADTIYFRLQECESPEDLSEIMANTFFNAFGERSVTLRKPEEYLGAAKRIWDIEAEIEKGAR